MRVASTRAASTWAKRAPRQVRGPPPNGYQACSGTASGASASQRSGRNSSGRGNQRGSRCVVHWLHQTTVPAGTRAPPSVAPGRATAGMSQAAWVQAQRLLDDLPGPPEPVVVVDGGRAPRQYVVQLGFEPGAGRRGAGEQVQGPRQRRGGGLVTGGPEGDGLVAHLLGRQRPALLVAGREEPAEQVVALVRVVGRAQPLLDEPVHLGVHGGHRGQQGPPGRGAHPGGQEQADAAQLGSHRPPGQVHRVAQRLGLLPEVVAEQGAQYHPLGDQRHLLA